MNYSLRSVVDELLISMQQVLKGSKVTPIQMAYWVTVTADRLKSQHLVKRRTSQFIETFADIPIQLAEDNSVKNAIKGRKYAEVPQGFYNFDLDRGINYVAFYNDDPDCRPEFAYQLMNRTSQVEAHHLYSNKHEMPSVKNAYWYVNGSIMTFLGLEETTVDTVEMGIFTTFASVGEIDIDGEFNFPQELMPILQKQVIDLGRFVMMIPKDRLNDGNNDPEPGAMPQQKITSVNAEQNL